MKTRVLLRSAQPGDVAALHALFAEPAVYRYLADGAAPPQSVSEAWVAADRSRGLGLWLLSHGDRIDGCVRLSEYGEPRIAELTYLLHPRVWGRGLATRMSWTVMQRAFATGAIDAIIAGADVPNGASIAVMRRLAMQFRREVQYPLGKGVEYRLGVADSAPDPPPESIPLAP